MALTTDSWDLNLEILSRSKSIASNLTRILDREYSSIQQSFFGADMETIRSAAEKIKRRLAAHAWQAKPDVDIPNRDEHPGNEAQRKLEAKFVMEFLNRVLNDLENVEAENPNPLDRADYQTREDARFYGREIGLSSKASDEPDIIDSKTLAIVRARELAHRIMYDLDHVGRSQARQAREERADYLARDLLRVLDGLTAQFLDLDPLDSDGLGTVLLSGVLNDFTAASLDGLDLSGIDLEGVLWSVWGTSWPDTVDIDRLKYDSREVDEGSGVYEIMSGQQRAFSLIRR